MQAWCLLMKMFIQEIEPTLCIHLKRGYSVDVIEDTEEPSEEIVILGNYSKSDYNSTLIVSRGGGITNSKRKSWTSHSNLM